MVHKAGLLGLPCFPAPAGNCTPLTAAAITPARTQGKAPEVGVLCRPVCARACPNAPRREHERVRCGLGPLLVCCQQDAVAGAARK
eukprot:6204677-Pleurochrysis_carterae.AAC.1